MSKYLLQASYSADGLKGLMKDKASGRKAAVEKLFASVGGKVESVYYCFGDYDVVLIAGRPGRHGDGCSKHQRLLHGACSYQDYSTAHHC